MITTAELQALTRPILADVIAALGHDLMLVRPATDTPTFGSLAVNPTETPLRGLLMPASSSARQTAADSKLPVPSYEVYLAYDAALLTPGWHLRHGEIRYYPKGDARDEGGQQILLVVPLGSPGEVSASGPP